MHREMRRKNLQRSEEEAYQMLEAAQWGVLSLTADSSPYGVPMSHALCGKTIYFHCAKEGEKLDLLRANPAACFTVVTYTEVLPKQGTMCYASVMAFGPVHLVEDEAGRQAGFDAINAKYAASPELGRTFVKKWGAAAEVLVMDIERITAKSNRKEG